jgi:amino acid adenylation domain-containing protein
VTAQPVELQNFRERDSRHAGPRRGLGERLLIASAADKGALEARLEQVTAHVRQHGGDQLADVAFTLARGRRAFAHRACVVLPEWGDRPSLAGATVLRGRAGSGPAAVAFLFPGQGAQFIGMGRSLYESSAHYRDTFERCEAILRPALGIRLGELLLVEPNGADPALEQKLTSTSIAQPALFVVEYALASLLMHLGVRPSVLIGHSIGEFTAACLAGVFELEAALELVCERGRLMASMPTGSMLAVKCEPREIEDLFNDVVALAAHNAPGLSVVSGPSEAIESFRKAAEARGFEARALHTSHAFHSVMMEPVLGPFRAAVERAAPCPPRIPIISTMTGERLRDEEATSPDYWTKQLRNPVRFAEAASSAADDPARIFLEVGPGVALITSVAKLTAAAHRPRKLIETLGHPKADIPASDALLTSLANLWIHGTDIDWGVLHGAGERKLVRLPTYPYRRRKHWIEPPRPVASSRSAGMASTLKEGSETEAGRSPLETGARSPAEGGVLPRLKALLESRLGRKLEEEELELKFLELGFDSLALSQLAGKLRQEFGVRVPVRLLFEQLGSPSRLAAHVAVESPPVNEPATQPAPLAIAASAAPSSAGAARQLAESSHQQGLEARLARIEGLLEALLRGAGTADSPVAPWPSLGSDGVAALARAQAAPKRPRAREGGAELTASQREIWVAVRVGGREANLAYNECRVFLFDGEVDERALVDSLAELCVRHEALRQTFSEDGNLCITHPRGTVPLEIHDLRGVSQEEGTKQVQALAGLEVGVPFDLVTGPLIRGRLIGLSDTEKILILCAHHVVVDGSSWEILIRELAELYSARLEQREPKLPAAQSFAEYAELEDEYRASGKAAEAAAFWVRHLSGQTEDLSLPADRPRPAQRSYRSARIDQQFAPEFAKRIRGASAKLGVTTQTFLLSAFELLLSRLSRQADFVCGVPASGQAAVGMDSLVGHCVHVLPVRCQIDSARSVKVHVQATQRTMLDCLEHQRATFTEILPKLNRPRDPSRPALVQVAFGMGRSQKRPQFAGTNTALRVVPRVRESFELYVYATENLGGLEISWSYNEDLFDAETIELWQRCFATLVGGLLDTSSDVVVGALPLLAAEDSAKLIELARGPVVERGAHLPVHRAFAEQAALSPQRTAVIDLDGPHSYGQLDQRANQFAHYLRSRGLRKGDLVSICLDRNADLVAAMIGVWRAGCGYVPLDPGYPTARIQMILEDSKSSLVLTTSSLLKQLPWSERTLCLDELELEIRRQPTTPPPLDPAPEDTAYVIFTSGSTGRPKGVQIPQGAFENFIRAMQKEPGFTSEDCILALTTVSFDISGLELFLPLATGGRLAMATSEQAVDPRQLRRLLLEHRVTVVQATPATWQMLFDSSWPGDARLKVLCGGEALTRQLAERLSGSCGQVWNVYGPTETTVWSSAKRIVAGSDITIGRPIDNTTMYVLDERRQLVPLGAHGELWIGGDGVASGYLGQEELTRERFVQSPFDGGQRIYRTGDLARVRLDGEFECLGRVDFQVKIRGYRIELGEVEAAILRHPQVRACVVVARDAEPGGKILAGYLVPKPGQTLEVEELRLRLGRELPAYMVPSAYGILDALPMTPNNKVDRKALPPLQTAATEHREPRDSLEARLLTLWKEALGVEALGTNENFYSVGGHSLMAVRLVERINDEFAAELAVNEFFNHPTVEGLAAVLRPRGARASAKVVAPESVRSAKVRAKLGVHQGLFCIQEGRPGGIPLFLIHGDRANGLLLPELGPDCEVWGYHHQGSDGERIQLMTVESLARRAHDEWTSSQGQRPCVIAGHSLGALVAYHIAYLRELDGLKTPSVVVIDARHPSALGGRLAGFGPNGVKARVQSLLLRREAESAIRRAHEFLDRGEPVPLDLRPDYILSAYRLAGYRYKAPKWSGNLEVIRSREWTQWTPEDYWERSGSGRIRRVVIEGSHLSIVRSPEGVAAVGRRIRDVLEELRVR